MPSTPEIAAGTPETRSGALVTSILGAEKIAGLDTDQWDRLSRDAISKNPFYARPYLLAGLSTIDSRSHLQAYVVRTNAGRMVGLFPFRRRFGTAIGAANLYQFSGVPLVARECASAVVKAWADNIASGELPPVWSFTNLPLDDELTTLIVRHASANGLVTEVVNAYRRPKLTRDGREFRAHLDEVMPKSRRKDIERSIRRLGELGQLKFERSTEPEAVAALVSSFLEMERVGWKGQAGTAFLCRPDSAAFATAAFGSAPAGSVSIDTLFLDEQPIAFSINIAAGETLFTPKCTYDEQFRRFSPGIVLEYYAIEQFFRDETYRTVDAATTVDGHLVQSLWNGSARMGQLVVGRKPQVLAIAGWALGRERLKHLVKGALRRLPAKA